MTDAFDVILDDLRHGLHRRAARRRLRAAAATGAAAVTMAVAAAGSLAPRAHTLAATSVGNSDATSVLLHGCSGDCLGPLRN